MEKSVIATVVGFVTTQKRRWSMKKNIGILRFIAVYFIAFPDIAFFIN